MAQQLKQPVVLVCTSGSALLNYYPAIAEAFYSDIPLVVISADRPVERIDIGDGQIDKAQLAKMIEAIDVEVGVALLDPEDEGVGYRNLVRSRSEVHGTVSISVGIPHDLPYPDEVLEVINDDPFQPGEVPDVTTSNYKTISTPSEGNDLQNTMKSVVGSMVAIYDESAGVLSNEQLIALLTEEISDIVTKYDFVKMLPESTSIDANDVGDVAYKACIANKLEKLYPKKIPTVEAPGDDETSGTTISRKP